MITTDELVRRLIHIYKMNFAGKKEQRFLIRHDDLLDLNEVYLLDIIGIQNRSAELGYYLLEIPYTNLYGFIPKETVVRWRKASGKVVQKVRYHT